MDNKNFQINKIESEIESVGSRLKLLENQRGKLVENIYKVDKIKNKKFKLNLFEFGGFLFNKDEMFMKFDNKEFIGVIELEQFLLNELNEAFLDYVKKTATGCGIPPQFYESLLVKSGDDDYDYLTRYCVENNNPSFMLKDYITVEIVEDSISKWDRVIVEYNYYYPHADTHERLSELTFYFEII